MAQDAAPQGNRLPPADGICRECLASKQPKVANPQIVAIYCEHNQAGAIMQSQNGQLTGEWLVYTPISAGAFTSWLSSSVMTNMPRRASRLAIPEP